MGCILQSEHILLTCTSSSGFILTGQWSQWRMQLWALPTALRSGACVNGPAYNWKHFSLGQRAPLLWQRFNNHITTAGATTTNYQRKTCWRVVEGKGGWVDCGAGRRVEGDGLVWVTSSDGGIMGQLRHCHSGFPVGVALHVGQQGARW